MKELGWGRTVHCLRNGKAAREFTVSHEQTEANPAQPRERLENAGERHLRRSTDCLGITLTAKVQNWTSEIERVTPKLEIVGSGQDWYRGRI
jgi:hypothetical protein